MGIIGDITGGITNSLRWRAENEVIGGIDSGVRSAIKGLKNRCPKCHKPIPEDGAMFCPNCRTSLVLVCKNPNCGKQSPLGTKFCPSCGSTLGSTKSTPETITEPQKSE